MAELSLAPNPTLLVVQTGIFLTNVWLVNTLILKPYQKLKAARDQATVGNQDEARRTLQEVTTISEAIKQKTTAALEQARQSIKSARDQAQNQQAQLTAAASAESQTFLDGFRTDLKTNLASERAKSKEILGTLSDEIFKKLLN
jgi:F0F1-type ATP synthase membrane subunit b/b'